MWLVYAIITFFAWGAADLFYKKGNSAKEQFSHIKTAVLVGFVMGVTACITLLTKHISYNPRNLLIYAPVSAMYILSMVVGYFGLRYLAVSISSPIQNASGAVSAVLLMLFLWRLPTATQMVCIFLVTAGVLILGIIERQKELKLNTTETQYHRGFAAVLIPVVYCFIDSLGTFLDGWYLDSADTSPLLGVTESTLEDTANISYQLTFFLVALLFLAYLLVIKKEVLHFPEQKDRLIAALLETGGQLSYVYALSGNGIVAAPVISSYCVGSLLLGRIILKEKLSNKQYFAVILVLVGIVLLGIEESIAA